MLGLLALRSRGYSSLKLVFKFSIVHKFGFSHIAYTYILYSGVSFPVGEHSRG